MTVQPGKKERVNMEMEVDRYNTGTARNKSIWK
jgi:hypothetical protein